MRRSEHETGHSDVTSRGIRVRVGAESVPEHSDPESSRWLYVYRVILSNEGDEPCTLLSRHWLIRDANNETREVRGAGVVGNQPRLAPGESFEYQSSCPLATSWGTMEGSYTMQRDDGSIFEARIGRFFLAPTTAPLAELEAGVE